MDIKFKKKDKNLLLQDLCSRLLYGIRCSFGVDDGIYEITGVNPSSCGASEIQATHIKSGINGDFTISSCKPYLFPLSSMTEEQEEEFRNLFYRYHESAFFFNERFAFDRYRIKDIGFYPCYLQDWLNKNHFDYRGLIPMGLAIDATGLNIY